MSEFRRVVFVRITVRASRVDPYSQTADDGVSKPALCGWGSTDPLPCVYTQL